MSCLKVDAAKITTNNCVIRLDQRVLVSGSTYLGGWDSSQTSDSEANDSGRESSDMQVDIADFKTCRSGRPAMVSHM